MIGAGIAALSLALAAAVAYAAHAAMERRRMRTLFRVSLRLNSTIKRKELLRIIMETAEKTLRAEGSSIILVDKERQELFFEVATGEKGDEVREIRLRMGEGIAGWVAQTGESVLIPNAAKDPRWSNRVSNRVGMPTRNMLCVPVVSNGETLGVLQVINKKRNGTFRRSDLRLLELVASPAAVALENMLLYEALVKSMETLRETTAAKERMESELKIAQDIQRSFLPGDAASIARVELAARLQPAREVGGDLYHFIELGEERLLLCLGDVSDKGMPAALFMSGLMIWIQAKAKSYDSPAAIVADINREVSDEDSTMFATMFLAVLDARTGRLRYCDAGHCTPYLLGEDGAATPLETSKHLPVGVFEDTEYEDREIALSPGQSLVLYTDGITEAESPAGEWFGTNGLLEALSRCGGLSPREAADALVASVQSFSQGLPPSDDIAVMAVKYGKN
ncbi:GAF domain-containing protein [Paenibacillus antri]|uniref:GAF domain-containing protein n=1 Tax=Paenibacillus antri TaxID=2582848 RepID=A0A5R9GKA1_9BACL|nr:GAF domain-containing SpoIIE family protein phosphatase [Paenibacillus antri]TLS53984.1 GAF domain-containing protein [Paenibacillus antri]